jgi:tRNA threonylcarbamoyl adenosine modification protein YeaZ
MLLAIDTSGDTASLALFDDGQPLAELTWQCRGNHSTELLPRLNQLLGQSRLETGSITAIAVALGPGSYNGLRVGLATAKGLALSLGVPLLGLSTLEAEAYSHAETGLPIYAVARAGREYAAAAFRGKGQRWHRIEAEHITTVAALCDKVTDRTVFIGDAIAIITAELRQRLGAKAIIASPAARLRRAGYLAELGLKRLLAGDHDDPASLQPIYLRKPQITKPRNRSQTVVSRKQQRAVIWDMDGVMVDSAACHFKAWQAAFKKRGIDYTEEDFRHGFGQRNDNIISTILGANANPEVIEAIAAEKEAGFRRRIGRRIEPLPGVATLMRSLAGKGYKMAVASSAPLKNIDLIIKGLKLEGCCPVIISERDVTRGKPDPQAFLMAAERLGVKPQNCLVIEDAVAGVAAAGRAGMAAIAVTNTHPAESLEQADLIVASLEEVTAAVIDKLISKNRRD